jgi:hypothetical protein
MFGNLFNRAKNFFGNIGNKIKDVITPVPGDTNIPPAVRRFLRDHGNEEITSLKVARVPISRALDKLLNLVSLGGFDVGKQRTNVDDFFHLFLVVNDKYRIEKNQLVKAMDYKPAEKEESSNVPLQGKKLTINELMANGAAAVGNADFYKNYSAFNKNCQWWVMNVLKANGLDNPTLEGFVKQSLDELVPAVGGFTTAFSNATTDLGARIDEGIQNLTNGLVALKDGGLVRRENRPFPKIEEAPPKPLFNKVVETGFQAIRPYLRPFMHYIGFKGFNKGGIVKRF